MGYTVLHSTSVPPEQRFDWWCELINRDVAPVRIQSRHTSDFLADAGALDLGAVQLTTMSFPPIRSLRTPALIRHSDPEDYELALIMEESVLYFRTVEPEAMRGQLRHLLAVMPLAALSLGIIPFTAQRTVWPLEAFYVHDDTMAVVETLTAEIKVSQPREIADYMKAFTGLAEMAAHGDAARALIQAAIDALE